MSYRDTTGYQNKTTYQYNYICIDKNTTNKKTKNKQNKAKDIFGNQIANNQYRIA